MIETGLELLPRVIIFAAGLFIVLYTVLSAIRTFILPRGSRPWLTSWVFRTMYNVFFRWRVLMSPSYEDRDRVMMLYAPITLFILPVAWLVCIMLGYTGMFWAVSNSAVSWRDAFVISGSSLMTLGFKFQDEILMDILAFSEAALGMMLVALLIGYLPTMYSAFSRREAVVTLLDVRAGVPNSSLEMILRLNRIGVLANEDEMKAMWRNWELWFAEVEETHTTLAPLIFFRSPQSHRSWITAAGTILDAGAIIASTVDYPPQPHIGLCIRSGYVMLRDIADLFDIPYDANPKTTDVIHITRDEFDEMYNELVAHDVPVKPDRDQCWRDFSGWRVNYDVVLLQLARLTWSPYSPWVSDRSVLWVKGKRVNPNLLKNY